MWMWDQVGVGCWLHQQNTRHMDMVFLNPNRRLSQDSIHNYQILPIFGFPGAEPRTGPIILGGGPITLDLGVGGAGLANRSPAIVLGGGGGGFTKGSPLPFEDGGPKRGVFIIIGGRIIPPPPPPPPALGCGVPG